MECFHPLVFSSTEQDLTSFYIYTRLESNYLHYPSDCEELSAKRFQNKKPCKKTTIYITYLMPGKKNNPFNIEKKWKTSVNTFIV